MISKENTTIEEVKTALHYPECWDTMAYPTLLDAIKEISNCTVCNASPDTLSKTPIDCLTDIYGFITSLQTQEIIPILGKIKNVDDFGKIAKKLYKAAGQQFKPNPVTLTQKVFAELNKVTSESDIF